MKRILLALTEPVWGSSAQFALGQGNEQWTVDVVPSAADALERLSLAGVDVLVFEFGLSDMNETGFLDVLASDYAGLMHIVLLDEDEMDLAARDVPHAAHYLCRPVSVSEMENTIARVVFMQDLMNGERIRTAIGRFTSLPSLPQIYTELMQLLRDPDAGAADVAEIIQRDIGMTAKVLQMANSSFFAVPEEITNVRMAVTYVGFKLVQNLVLSVTLFDKFDFSRSPPGFDPEEVQRHAFRTATAAYRLFKNEPFRDDVFSAAMLHDVGKLVMASELAESYCGVYRRLESGEGALAAVERERIGADHAEIGGFLLMEWGLPLPVVEAVTHHHEPSRVPQGHFGILAAVHVANALVGEWEAEAGLRRPGQAPPLDHAMLEALGMSHRLETWRDHVDAVCAETTGLSLVE